MGYTKQAKLLGDQRVFSLTPEVKKYTLRDVGFVESKGGKFVLERPLDPQVDFAVSLKLKVTISADLKTFKMVTTNGNGLREINLFKKNDPQILEQLKFSLQELQDRQIIRLN
ncbi:cysteine desulfurase [Liquorilactobacillus sicerae]|uniref:cysteine desulfurase n=1 Tax=Liquorilactobacillus sicerae TaxID=1416943 RepID=UPI002480776B|nr:cysteine desulfurase [Liquorilactobacillus sicerae]